MAKFWIIIAALLGASAVGMGAFHAHGLSELLEQRMLSEAKLAKAMDDADVAVKYQMYHALAIFGIALVLSRRCTWLGNIAAAAMLLGVLGFSGGLYLIVFDVAKLHQIIPIGGGLMIVGWLALGAAAFTMPGASCEPANKPGQ
jgi:uncharacterized membrane protein YgdD (TMEM256/DUF423 family)